MLSVGLGLERQGKKRTFVLFHLHPLPRPLLHPPRGTLLTMHLFSSLPRWRQGQRDRYSLIHIYCQRIWQDKQGVVRTSLQDWCHKGWIKRVRWIFQNGHRLCQYCMLWEAHKRSLRTNKVFNFLIEMIFKTIWLPLWLGNGNISRY